jgi:hypothetical protein
VEPLKMEAWFSSETPVPVYWNTGHYSPEDSNLDVSRYFRVVTK